MMIPSRLCGLAVLAAVAALSLSPRQADATHAPVWGPAMEAAPVDTVASGGSVSFTLPLYNFRDFQYYAKFHVGSSPQLVRLAFDVGASDLAVLAVQYEGHFFYNESQSSTYEADGRPVTLDDTTSGVLVRDRFVLHEGAVVNSQYFTAINNVTVYQPYYKDVRFDGWFGLAPRDTQSVGQVPTILHALFGRGVVGKPVVGLSMPQGENGFVSFGELPNIPEAELAYVTQEHSGMWTYPIDKIDVGGKPIDSSTTRTDSTPSFAVIDNLVSVLVGPPQAVEAIAKAAGAKKLHHQMWAVPCDASLPAITFWNGKNAISFTAKELVGQRVSSTDCFFNIHPRDSWDSTVSDWSFGLPVFQRYVLGFFYEQPPRLGFALRRP